VDKVQADLEAKRFEFKQRMEACSQRQIEIQKKQQKVSLVFILKSHVPFYIYMYIVSLVYTNLF